MQKTALCIVGNVLNVFKRPFLNFPANLQQPANAAMFELHVYQGGEWKILKTVDSRNDAMSAAFEFERSGRFSGAKVYELVPDPQSTAVKQNLLHRWSAEDDSRATQHESEENFERQRELRRQIRAIQRAENKGWKKQVWNIVVVSSLSLILVSGFVGLLMLGAG